MNQHALKYSATMAIITITTEIYAAVFHEQGLGRMATGLAQAIILSGLAYWGFVVGFRKHSGSTPKLKGLIMGGVLTWAVSYQAFWLLYSGFGLSLVPVIVPFLLVGGIAYILGTRGGFAQPEPEK